MTRLDISKCQSIDEAANKIADYMQRQFARIIDAERLKSVKSVELDITLKPFAKTWLKNNCPGIIIS